MPSWRDLTAPLAVALEGPAAAAAVRGDDGLALALHVASAGCVAVALQRRVATGPMGFVFVLATALFLPLAGGAGLLAAALVAPPAATPSEPDLVRTPVPGVAEAPAGSAPPLPPAGALAPDARIRAARGRNDPAAVALLRHAIEDRDEDVRLVAFAVLESKCRAAYRRIHAATRELDDAPPAARAALHRRAATEHWELAFLGLAQGECLEHVLERARHHALAALEADRDRPSLHFLLGRVALRRGDAARAEAALVRAAELGLPRETVKPYLAEAAFLARRFDLVRRRLAEAGTSRANPALERIRRYWS